MFNYHRYTALAMLHDLLVAALAWVVAYLLRFNFDLPQNYQSEMWRTLLWVAPLQSLVFWYMRLYRGTWRYASVAEVRQRLQHWVPEYIPTPNSH